MHVKSVEFLFNDGIFDIDEARLLIVFDDDDWLLLDNVTYKQDNIIFRSYNGFGFLIFFRFQDKRIEHGVRFHTSFSAEFYEKLLGG
jgi:hypothetical protein